MKSRLLASLALAAAVVIGLTGCTFITPQSTTIQYSPGDGVNVDGSAPLEVRNVIVVANPEGTAANLIAAVVNPTSDAQTLRLEVGEARVPAVVRVPGNSVVSLGAQGEPPLELERFQGAPGTNVEIYFQSGDVNGVSIAVPIVDGSLSYYADLAPQDAS